MRRQNKSATLSIDVFLFTLIIPFTTQVKKPLGIYAGFLMNTQNFTGYFWMNVVSYPCILNLSIVLTCCTCSNEG